ncbi:hypothetical protein EVAR_65006_1 [Eumeta japonica]|uniref:Uncharacterized protein n=1 Tax=Eumeta variegata TaxID=151549 RepID=A0A4C1SLY5_EUMVA|nr:hypothetical protein EVAR_65006_1 [Eumeta japonica]
MIVANRKIISVKHDGKNKKSRSQIKHRKSDDSSSSDNSSSSENDKKRKNVIIQRKQLRQNTTGVIDHVQDQGIVQCVNVRILENDNNQITKKMHFKNRSQTRQKT